MNASALIRRIDLRLLPDPSRVITRAFHPGQEALIEGLSRAETVVQRVLDMDATEVTAALDAVMQSFADRHDDFRATLRERFEVVADRLIARESIPDLGEDRVALIGACLTQEFAVEAAALFNPSIVAHPDQSGCAVGQLRVLLSVRAVGEGHVSSVEFRTGTLGPGHAIDIDPPAPRLSTGEKSAVSMPVALLRSVLAQSGDAVAADSLLRQLPETFTPEDLDALLASHAADNPLRVRDDMLSRIRRAGTTRYRLSFSPDSDVSARVIVPNTVAESHGIEDVRFVRFVDSAGDVSYLGTYTAFDGTHVAPYLLSTRDFVDFEAGPMIGPAAQNKGMALFPRRIGGDMWALSRWDRENLSVARSADGIDWGSPQVILAPSQAWNVIQLGACSSPIETAAGWLVLIHGVGPMRVYSIGALLLDLEDPTSVIGVLDTPLLSPDEGERDGYVPNVVYSCGAIVHGSTVVMPYGCSDACIRFAVIDLPGLLAQLLDSRA